MKSKVQDYIERAEDCENRAALAHDLAAAITFREAARVWRELARQWIEFDAILRREFQTFRYSWLAIKKVGCRDRGKNLLNIQYG
jgi:hypothetical protein